MLLSWLKPRIRRLIGFAGLGTLLASCATAPSGPIQTAVASAFLETQAAVVLRLDARAVKAWSTALSSEPELAALGPRTRVVWAALDFQHWDDWSQAAQAARLVLEGDFPRFGVTTMLSLDRQWQRTSTPDTWKNTKIGWNVAIPRDNLVVAYPGSDHGLRPDLRVLKDLDPEEAARHALWLSFWNPGSALFGSTGAKVLPVQRLDVVLDPVTDGLEGKVLVHFEDERSARAATVLMKLSGPAIRNRWGQDLQWTAQGATLEGSPVRISEKDLESLARQLLEQIDSKEAL